MRQYSLKKTFLLSTLFASIITLVVGIGLFSVIFQNTLDKTIENRFGTIQKRFTEEVMQDVLIGSFTQVQLKCQSYITDPTIVAILVKDNLDRTICDQKKPYPKPLEKLGNLTSQIYFDDNNNEVAGSVNIIYSYAVVDNIFYQSLWLLIIPFLILFFIQLFLGQTISYKVVRSIDYLSQKIKLADLQELMRLNEDRDDTFVAELDLLYNKIQELAQQTYEYQQNLLQQTKQETTVQVARQVAHDIRSPLSALSVILNQLGELPESKRIFLRNAIQRIDDIANELSSRALNQDSDFQDDSSETETVSTQLLSTLVESIISEKRIQYRSRYNLTIQLEKSENSYGLFSQLNPLRFKRVLSNLIDNSVEAIESSGEILVDVSRHDNNVIIQIKDDGQGIPNNVLPNLMQKGHSYNKKSGSGLGLYDARKNLLKWKGSIDIQSQLGKGTTVTLTLPLASPPNWFTPHLNIHPDEPVYILDDDLSIHQIWTARFQEIDFPQDQIFHYTDPRLMIQDIQKKVQTEEFNPLLAFYLMDFELIDFNQSGIDVIDKLKVSTRSVLVTSRFDEPEVVKACQDRSLRILPKSMAGFISIQVGKQKSQQHNTLLKTLVLIDDDSLMRSTWSTYGKLAGYNVSTFENLDEFLKVKSNFQTPTPIYVDFKLGNNITGAEVTRQLADLGYENLFIATGYDDLNINDFPWVKDIVGKMPPFKS